MRGENWRTRQARRRGSSRRGGEYHDRGSLPDARRYAEQTGLPVIECSFCKPGGQPEV